MWMVASFTELNEIADQDTARTHPLNCATMSAKPYPYFDGGLVKAQRPGRFSFFSSRNNNFSNRCGTIAHRRSYIRPA